MKLIDKDALVAEIERRINNLGLTLNEKEFAVKYELKDVLSFLDTLEVKDPYEEVIQYDSVKSGIQAHAETYSFNIESKLFNQLTKEQQELWRKEIEQAVISGGEAGVELARDPRYKENLEVKEIDLDEEFNKYCENLYLIDLENDPYAELFECAKHFFKLGLMMKK